jgi:hypothetical protein
MFSLQSTSLLLALECQEVIALRMLKAMRGGVEALDETSLMWREKVDAAWLHIPAVLAGGSVERMIDSYRTIVQANVLRLADGPADA